MHSPNQLAEAIKDMKHIENNIAELTEYTHSKSVTSERNKSISSLYKDIECLENSKGKLLEINELELEY